jgi:hypothetical protein
MQRTTPRNAVVAGAVASAGVAILTELSASRRVRLTVLATILTAGIVAMTDTSKTKATEARVNALVPAVGAANKTIAKITAGAGQIPDTARNLSNTKTGLIQDTHTTGNFTGSTGPQIGGASAHTHNITHNHNPDDHTHFTQIEADFNNVVNEVQHMRQVLAAAGIG